VATVYDLFRKTLKEDPKLQWDRIMKDMHTKDPWEDLKGIKHGGIHRRSIKSLWECINFHKRTVYSIDAAEQQRPCTYYVTSRSLQGPVSEHT